jgi:hypothetical protein
MPIEKKLTQEQALKIIRDRVSLDTVQQAIAKAENQLSEYWKQTREFRAQHGPNVTLLRTDIETMVAALNAVLDASDGTITF